MNRNEIANRVVNSNNIVGADMMTNRERFLLVCNVLRCDSIALEERFDFDLAIQTGDPMTVYAGINLASLQFEYFTRLHLENLIDEESYQWWMGFLEISKSKMRWAFTFLRFDREPSPYPFLN